MFNSANAISSLDLRISLVFSSLSNIEALKAEVLLRASILFKSSSLIRVSVFVFS